ncbi:hypothetical protein Cni_G01505 [Canna indica]|uniref:ENHANCER OF AG-4 protein 2 n=1 Tax=Canna indica TaxID=4628 RepID=A0AAQ3PYS1_9LILI|nr:hypothetical protein Cni_G01505 [Canna indica]
MAPGRKKGANRVKAVGQLKLGDLVLAKVKGYPAWPAKISRPEDFDRSPDPRKYFVQFFGTSEIAFVVPADIQVFTNESKSKLIARCQGKTVKYFAQAVEEICEAFDELNKKQLEESGQGTDSYRTNAVIQSSPIIDFDDSKPPVEHNAASELKDLEEKVEHVASNNLHEMDVDSKSAEGNASSDLTPSNLDGAESLLKRKKNSNNGVQATKEKKLAVPKSASHSCSGNEEESMNTNLHDIKNKDLDLLPKMEIEEQVQKASAAGGMEGCSDSKDEIDDNQEGATDAPKVQEIGHQTTKGVAELKQKVDNASEVKKGAALPKQLKGSYGKGSKLPSEGNRRAASCDYNREPSGNTSRGTDSKNLKISKSLKRSKEHSVDKEKLHSDVCKDTADASNQYADPGSISSGEGSEKTSQARNKKHKLDGKKDLQSAKRPRLVEENGDKCKNSRQDDVSQTDVKSKASKVEKAKKIGISIKTENLLTPEKHNELVLPTTQHAQNMDEVADPATKATANTIQTGSRSVKDGMRDRSFSTHIRYRRRSCRFDDEEEEQRTPIHKESASNLVLSHACMPVFEQKLHTAMEGNKESPPVNIVTEKPGVTRVEKSSDTMTSPTKIIQKNERRAEKCESPHNSGSPTKPEYQRLSFGDSRPPIVSPKVVVTQDPALKSSDKTSVKSHSKASGSSLGKKSQISQSKQSNQPSEGLNSFRGQSTPEKIKASNKTGNAKSASKSNMHSTSVSENRHDSKFSIERNSEKDVLGDKRLGAADTSTSMKHLIAVAQAKRREAQSRGLLPENSLPTFISTPNLIHGRSPSPATLIPFSSANFSQKDIKGPYATMPFDSPHAAPHEVSSSKVEIEEYEHRTSPEYMPPGSSLSGDTEAAVARDALEGMIETLSRTKDSIGRATRHAIDCAKFGIASEIVELLILKLENEPSFHRRVDLFFLVDSITQCSHTQKGIAGSSYIPAVQEALPRLLSAAAPPGASARENRRQCLKVLKLWLERKILPESLLRRCIDDIEVPSEDLSAAVFLKRPSRAERSVDDPIREMEGMHVDEYGSNATFQLPGLLLTRVFEDEDDPPITLCREYGDEMPVEAGSSLEEIDNCAFTPSDRHHHILKDVDGELEMEDATLSKEEKGIIRNDDEKSELQCHDSGKSLEPTSTSPIELPPLPTGPPPPLDSPPPPPPPLPPSPPPPPPPPPPLSPSPPPPPPPPPLPPPGQTSLPSVALPPPQPSSSPSLFYPSMQEDFRASNGNQMVHVPGNAAVQGQEAALGNEVVLQHHPSFVGNGMGNTHSLNNFTSSRPFEYGHNELYLAQTSHQIHHFQQGNAPFHQRPYHSLPPSQTPSNYALPATQNPAGHFSHVTPMNQQPVQQPYNSYPLPPVPNSQRQYVSDEQRRVHPSGFSPDNQHSAWVSGARPSCSGAPIAQDGYTRSSIERPSSNSMGFQLPLHTSMPSGGSVQGHGFPQLLPGRPDITGLNCWRPG